MCVSFEFYFKVTEKREKSKKIFAFPSRSNFNAAKVTPFFLHLVTYPIDYDSFIQDSLDFR